MLNPRYALGVKDYRKNMKEWSCFGDLKGNFLCFSRSKNSSWTSRVCVGLSELTCNSQQAHVHPQLDPKQHSQDETVLQVFRLHSRCIAP